MSIETALIERLAEEPNRNIWFRSDFLDLGGYDPVGRALQQVCEKQLLTKLAHGTYARLEYAPNLERHLLAEPLIYLAEEFLFRKGMRARADAQTEAYNQNKTTQIPMRQRLIVRGLRKDIVLRYKNQNAIISGH